MIPSSPKAAPKSDRLAVMVAWLQSHSDTPWMEPSDIETVEWFIECRYPGGFNQFNRDHGYGYVR